MFIEVDTGDLNIESGNSSYILPNNPKLRNARIGWQQRAKDLFSAGGSAASIRDALKNEHLFAGHLLSGLGKA